MNCVDVIKILKQSLNKDCYIFGREWPYKNVKRKIIAEKYMSNKDGSLLIDYKLMCFNGKVKCFFTVTNRFQESDIYVNYYDTNWMLMPFERHYKEIL